MPEGEGEEQEIGNLFEKIMENFPSLAKEILSTSQLPGSPGSSESPIEVGPKKAHTKGDHH